MGSGDGPWDWEGLALHQARFRGLVTALGDASGGRGSLLWVIVGVAHAPTWGRSPQLALLRAGRGPPRPRAAQPEEDATDPAADLPGAGCSPRARHPRRRAIEGLADESNGSSKGSSLGQVTLTYDCS